MVNPVHLPVLRYGRYLIYHRHLICHRHLAVVPLVCCGHQRKRRYPHKTQAPRPHQRPKLICHRHLVVVPLVKLICDRHPPVLRYGRYLICDRHPPVLRYGRYLICDRHPGSC